MDKAFGGLIGRHTYRILLVSAIAVAISGCSQTEYGPTGDVSGTLSYQGKTLAPRTMVIFKNLTTGHSCFGETDEQGNYTLDSWNDGNLPVGTYGVMIQPPEPIDPETIDPEALLENPQLMENAEPVFDFPKKYSVIASSGMSFDVKEGANEFPIDLVD